MVAIAKSLFANRQFAKTVHLEISNVNHCEETIKINISEMPLKLSEQSSSSSSSTVRISDRSPSKKIQQKTKYVYTWVIPKNEYAA